MTRHAALAECERDGRRDVERYRRTPEILRDSRLGAFTAGNGISATLRRALLAVRLPWPLLAPAVAALPEPASRARCERFLEGYAYWQGVRKALPDRRIWQQLTQAPVVLMYHAIGAAGEAGSTYVVPRRRFRWQMAWLYWRGYTVLALPDLARARADGRLVPPRTIVLTFDDGYADNYTEALPLLRRYGFPATFFLVTGGIGGTAGWTADPHLAGRPLMTHRQIEEMLAAGMNIGGHTVSHPSLTGVSPARCEAEVQGARADLEQRFARPVRTFAYPFGDYDAATTEAVDRAGFDIACCSRSGRAEPQTPVFEVRRNEVRGTDSMARFALTVWAGTPWRRPRTSRDVRPRVAARVAP